MHELAVTEAILNIVLKSAEKESAKRVRTVSLRIGVIEADLDSTVDADKVAALGIPAVQLETGGYCHVDARMTDSALRELDLENLDLLFLENVGNLICTAQSETGAHLNLAVLSVPEGDDKPLKYPVMFRYADVMILNKADYLAFGDFDRDAFEERVRVLNSNAPMFTVSCRTGAGIAEWSEWLRKHMEEEGLPVG